MSLRYLVGPVAPGRAAPWQRHRAEGLCLAFHPGEGADVRLAPGDSWDDLLTRLPADWRPDFVLLHLSYTTVPDCLWQAPVPLVALAPDWPLHWHYLRLALPFVQRTLTDSRGVDTLRKAGLGHAARANLFGLQGLFTAGPPRPAPPRDIDILFIGNLHPAVARDRLPWLARLARLSARYRVRIEQGVHGEDYRDLLLRSRVVFNRSARGEWNLRVGEACSCGALLLAERGNPEMHGVWHDWYDCVHYDEDDLERRLAAALRSEGDRAEVAERGRHKALEHTFERHWQDTCRDIEKNWPAIHDRLRLRPVADPGTLFRLRAWQALSAADDGDPTLAADLDATLARAPAPGFLHLARGLVDAWQTRCRPLTPLAPRFGGRGAGGEGGLAAEASPPHPQPLSPEAGARGERAQLLHALATRLHQAAQASPGNRMAGLDLLEVLAALGRTDLAVAGARQLLATLGRPLDEETLLTPSTLAKHER